MMNASEARNWKSAVVNGLTWALAVAMMLLIGTCAALAEEPPRSLLGGKDLDHGGMFALRSGVASVGGEARQVTGGRLQWIIDHRIGIGLGGFSTAQDVRFDAGRGAYDVMMECGGLEVEYMIDPDALLHPAFILGIGGGALRGEKVADGTDFTEGFYYLHPAVSAELNVTSWMRVAFSGGWRFASGIGVNPAGIGDSDMSGPMATATFKFGWF